MLCPMNRGRIGARALNLDLQAALNGDQSKTLGGPVRMLIPELAIK